MRLADTRVQLRVSNPRKNHSRANGQLIGLEAALEDVRDIPDVPGCPGFPGLPGTSVHSSSDEPGKKLMNQQENEFSLRVRSKAVDGAAAAEIKQEGSSVIVNAILVANDTA